ncbi:hypothetical protein [Pseudobacillus badius]|uniref:hypothetical protein n=1 Tax=Bacillus badius TaxID=1455 RepID=UPI0024A09625|nr:hypothetical protein [Bacillus badius]GLY12223.1 hypothetical protein Bbad01_34390 [Bacillus badius]
MTGFKACLVAESRDVWEELEKNLGTGFKNIVHVDFHFWVETHKAHIKISFPKNDEIATEEKELVFPESDNLVEKLCERFNIPFSSIYRLRFDLSPKEFPVFHTEFYPYVKDKSMLNTKNIRRHLATID